jgi:hypothetical protein
MVRARAAFHEIPSQIISAGRSARIGPIYGIISIIPLISARVKTRSVLNPNTHSTMMSQIYVVTNILTQSMRVALIHELHTCSALI